MKTLIIIPTIFEAEKLSVKTRLREITRISDKLLLTISGIAKSGIKTVRDIVPKEHIDKIILIGMCGDLTEHKRIGNIYIINSVTNKELTININNDLIINKLIKDIPKANDGAIKNTEFASLLTVNKPVFSDTRRSNLSKYAQLVDMETFHYTQLSKDLGIEFNSIRVVSDDCSNDLKNYFKGIEKDTTQGAGLKKAQFIIKDLFDSIVKQLS